MSNDEKGLGVVTGSRAGGTSVPSEQNQPSLERVSQMSDDELRVRVAELCGWSDIKSFKYETSSYLYITGTKPFDAAIEDERQVGMRVPDYHSDLNAMAKAEKTLNLEQQHDYGERLVLLVREPENNFFGDKPDYGFALNGWGLFDLATISARKRAECFVLAKSGQGSGVGTPAAPSVDGEKGSPCKIEKRKPAPPSVEEGVEFSKSLKIDEDRDAAD